MIDSNQEKLIDQICRKNPRLIKIYGNTDPTYSSCGFSYNLVDYGDYLLQFGSSAFGFGCKTRKVKKIKKQWIIDIMKYFKKYHNYEIIKIKRKYVIMNSQIDIDESFYDTDGTFIVDYGGYIETY